MSGKGPSVGSDAWREFVETELGPLKYSDDSDVPAFGALRDMYSETETTGLPLEAKEIYDEIYSGYVSEREANMGGSEPESEPEGDGSGLEERWRGFVRVSLRSPLMDTGALPTLRDIEGQWASSVREPLPWNAEDIYNELRYGGSGRSASPPPPPKPSLPPQPPSPAEAEDAEAEAGGGGNATAAAAAADALTSADGAATGAATPTTPGS